jgi:hypothetical protein
MVKESLEHVLIEPKTKKYDHLLKAERLGGDESVPSESALTFFFKWSYEFNHKNEYG